MVPIKSKPAANGAPKPPPSKSKATPTAPVRHMPPKTKSKAPPAEKPQPSTQTQAQKLIVASRGLKRKSTTPERIQFSSDEDDDSDDPFGNSDSDAPRKRAKSSVSSVDSPVPTRKLVREAAFGHEKHNVECMHGADATSGVYAAKFKNPWGADDFSVVELQYPSNTVREKFELKWPKNEKDDYRPWEDISETIKAICDHYIPEEHRDKYSSEALGFRFQRAWIQQSVPEFISIVNEFNDFLTQLIDDGTIRRHLESKHIVPLELTRRILDQIYARTVSPKVETLRAYQNGSDNVYGELLPRFCKTIFDKVNLSQSNVFVDLGSGVGNVVLQAALQVGCDSWGIEMMKNPCDLAELQAQEFPARTHLWGLDVGSAHLLRGDFTKNAEIREVLCKADVVLVNNQAFTPQLNDVLLTLFLDLKEGCKVVSLKPFIPDGHKITSRNYDSAAGIFVQQRYEYFSDCVSWTNQSGFWYIATVDRRPLKEFLAKNKQY